MLTKEGMAVFLMPNGDVFEIMAPQIEANQPELVELECPKAEFPVEDVHQARLEMEAIGIEFVGPVWQRRRKTRLDELPCPRWTPLWIDR